MSACSCSQLFNCAPLHFLLLSCRCWTNFSPHRTVRFTCFSTHGLCTPHVNSRSDLDWLVLTLGPKFYASNISRNVQCTREETRCLAFLEESRRGGGMAPSLNERRAQPRLWPPPPHSINIICWISGSHSGNWIIWCSQYFILLYLALRFVLLIFLARL
jgi:hypothetical protein